MPVQDTDPRFSRSSSPYKGCGTLQASRCPQWAIFLWGNNPDPPRHRRHSDPRVPRGPCKSLSNWQAPRPRSLPNNGAADTPPARRRARGTRERSRLRLQYHSPSPKAGSPCPQRHPEAFPPRPADSQPCARKGYGREPKMGHRSRCLPPPAAYTPRLPEEPRSFRRGKARIAPRCRGEARRKGFRLSQNIPPHFQKMQGSRFAKRDPLPSARVPLFPRFPARAFCPRVPAAPMQKANASLLQIKSRAKSKTGQRRSKNLFVFFVFRLGRNPFLFLS